MSTTTNATRRLRERASRPTATNADYWTFRSRPDSESADALAEAERLAARISAAGGAEPVRWDRLHRLCRIAGTTVSDIMANVP